MEGKVKPPHYDIKALTKERLLLNFLKNRRLSWIGHIIRQKEFVVNILEGEYPEKRPWEDLSS
jgi:hypothetical protein